MKSLLALLFAASALAADTNKTTNAVSKPSTNAPVVSRRTALEVQLKQIDSRIETLKAEDSARMNAYRLRTGKQLQPANTAALNVLRAQRKPIQAALNDLDIAEGKLDKHKLPKRYKTD